MNESKYEFKKIEALMQSDGEDIKQQLVFSGILIMLFEQFKKFMISILEEFFSDGSKVENDCIVHRRGSEFKEVVKSLGKGKLGQHKNDVFRASLYWLNSFEAITIDELNDIERLYLIRNNVGHELFNIIVEDCKDVIRVEDIVRVINIYSKVTKWWFKEIEATTNPSMIEHYESINFEAFETTEMTLLKMIISKALFGKEKNEVAN